MFTLNAPRLETIERDRTDLIGLSNLNLKFRLFMSADDVILHNMTNFL